MNDPVATAPSKLILIVLYQRSFHEADTIQSLLKCSTEITAADKVFVWDNSLMPQRSQDIAQIEHQLGCLFEYRNTPQNLSLAKIYNTVIRENPDYSLLFLFDQDSSFKADYFRQVCIATHSNPFINLFVPLIKNGAAIVSPGHFHYFKGKYWRGANYGIVASKNNVAIASGMAIRMSCLQSFGGFEEKLQLYGIDTNFMIRYAKDNPAFFVINTPFVHYLSDFTTESKAVKQKRFRDFKKASVINSRLFPVPVQWLTRLFLWYRSMRF